MEIFQAVVYFHGMRSRLIKDLALMQEREDRLAVEFDSLAMRDPPPDTTIAILDTATKRYNELFDARISWKRWRICFAAHKAGVKKRSVGKSGGVACVLRLRPAVKKRLLKTMIPSTPLPNVPRPIVLNGIKALGMDGRLNGGTVGVRIVYSSKGIEPLPPPFTTDLQYTRGMRFCFRADEGRWLDVFTKSNPKPNSVARMIAGVDDPRIWRRLHAPT